MNLNLLSQAPILSEDLGHDMMQEGSLLHETVWDGPRMDDHPHHDHPDHHSMHHDHHRSHTHSHRSNSSDLSDDRPSHKKPRKKLSETGRKKIALHKDGKIILDMIQSKFPKFASALKTDRALILLLYNVNPDFTQWKVPDFDPNARVIFDYLEGSELLYNLKHLQGCSQEDAEFAKDQRAARRERKAMRVKVRAQNINRDTF